MIEVGAVAPDFSLVDQYGDTITLSDYKGKRVLISWHPLAWTGICTDQMRALERNSKELKEKGIDLIVGVSVDAAPTKKVWASALILEDVHIVADFSPKGEMSKAYDAWSEEKDASGRAAVIVGADGKIEWSKQYELSELPDIEEILEVAGK